MKLDNKKHFVGRTLYVGQDRIVFNKERLSEIKEAITKQDIRELVRDGAIFIKPINGRAKVEHRTSRRRAGSVRKRVINGKREYMIITRKLRAYLAELRKQEVISREQWLTLRKRVRARHFRSKAHLKEELGAMKK
jgi:large subunit ribosomal protein L19e